MFSILTDKINIRDTLWTFLKMHFINGFNISENSEKCQNTVVSVSENARSLVCCHVLSITAKQIHNQMSFSCRHTK